MSTIVFDTHAFVKELTKPGCQKRRPRCWRARRRP